LGFSYGRGNLVEGPRAREILRFDWTYRGTSPIRNSAPIGPYSRTMPRTMWKPWGVWLLLMSEVPLYRGISLTRNSHPPRIAIGPYAEAYCRFLGRVFFL